MATLKTNTLTGTTTAGSIAVTGEGNSTTTNLQQGLAKSWVNLNGTATDAGTDLDGVRDSFNVASVVDQATGNSSVSYTNNMSNANFSITGYNSYEGLGSFTCFDNSTANDLPSTSSYNLSIVNRNGSSEDETYVFGAVHGDLA